MEVLQGEYDSVTFWLTTFPIVTCLPQLTLVGVLRVATGKWIPWDPGSEFPSLIP